MSAATPANVFLGTGRRKTSTARVRITEGSGKLLCNGREFDRYFSHENFAKQAYAPLLTVDMSRCSSIVFTVKGRVGFVDDGRTFGSPHSRMMSGA